MFVCVNFMKSYTSPPATFAECAAEAGQAGADLVYLVDSAGGMLPHQVSEYIQAVRHTAPEVRIGFHGHHNLGLGVANSLIAIQNGAEFVDTSLQGIGRSAGNTPTELLVCALMRCGIDMNIDPIALLDLGEEFVRTRYSPRGIDPFDVISGLAQFHSSYMPVIERVARKYNVDPRQLIVSVCAVDRINAPEALVDSVAQTLAAQNKGTGWKALYKEYYGEEQR
jgi:4-hydroxy-2-oxovalerate aldolase